MVLWRRRLLVLRSRDYSQLAGSLATVAIALLAARCRRLGLPWPRWSSTVQARYEADAPTRDLRKQVTAAIRGGRRVRSSTYKTSNFGLALAAETVARLG